MRRALRRWWKFLNGGARGDLMGAEANLAEAVWTYDPERDRDAKFRLGMDTTARWQAGPWMNGRGR
jgi:hypothetical protein